MTQKPNVKNVTKVKKHTKTVTDEKLTPYQQKQKEQKIIKKNFNDNKIKFVKPDGTDLYISEYQKIASLAKEKPEDYFTGEYFSFNEEENGTTVERKVFIPIFKDNIPESSKNIYFSDDHRKAVNDLRIVKKAFNDNKGKYVSINGEEFTLQDFHKLEDKKNLEMYVQGSKLSFTNELTSETINVFVPLIVYNH